MRIIVVACSNWRTTATIFVSASISAIRNKVTEGFPILSSAVAKPVAGRNSFLSIFVSASQLNLRTSIISEAVGTHLHNQAFYQETFDTLISIIRVGRAIQATPQHFHHDAHMLLRKENPMHQPRSFFEERVLEERRHA